MSEWNFDMSTAPLDGSRVLVRTPCFQWNTDVCQHVAVGHKAVEARFCAGMSGSEPRWHEWVGNEKTFSTDWIVAEAWADLPTFHAQAKKDEQAK